MKLILLQVGKTQSGWLEEGIREYLDRIQRYHPLEVVTIPESRKEKKRTVEEQKRKEGKLILSEIQAGDHVIILDEKGRRFSSRDFAGFVEQKLQLSYKRLVFLIGGPWGVSPEVMARADQRLSCSQMTFSHQMIRLIFAEQLYRGFTILKGEPYHHD